MPNDLPIHREKTAYERLKRRHQRFVDALVEGKSVAEAMRIIGNKSKHARIIGHRWMHEAEITAAVEERTQIAIRDAGINALTTMRQMAAIATSDVRLLTNEDGTHKAPHELDDATAWAVRSIDVEEVSTGGRTGTRYKYQFWDKPKANEFLGRAQKLVDSPSVKVDASRTVNNTLVVQGGLPSVDDWLAGFVRRPEAIDVAASMPNGSVLPAAIHAEPEGHGAPLAVCEVSADRGKS